MRTAPGTEKRRAVREARRAALRPGGSDTPAEAAEALHGAGRPESGQNSRFVTIDTFWRDMIGMESRGWYYRHRGDPGFPQAVTVGEKPMLVRAECEAYMDRLIERRNEKAPPKRGPVNQPVA